MAHRGSLLALGAAGLAALAALAACSNALGLAPATSSNVVDTVTLYALDGTALTSPSAYAIIGRTPVLTYQTAAFDFAFNFDSLQRPVFLPTGALKYAAVDTAAQPGLLSVTTTFDNTTLAPTGGYEIDKPFVVDPTQVTIARSRAEVCPDGTTGPLFAKIQVLTIDPVARTIRFLVLAGQNCGYRGLAPGIPDQ
jgi:hypothetical protein